MAGESNEANENPEQDSAGDQAFPVHRGFDREVSGASDQGTGWDPLSEEHQQTGCDHQHDHQGDRGRPPKEIREAETAGKGNVDTDRVAYHGQCRRGVGGKHEADDEGKGIQVNLVEDADADGHGDEDGRHLAHQTPEDPTEKHQHR